MAGDGKVVIETELDDSGAKSGMSKLGGTLSKMGSSVAGLGASALKGTAVAIAGVTTAIVGLGASAVSYNASMEQYSTSFEVMTGSAEKSAEIMATLKELGAKTPFEFEDLARSTQTLMAFGMTSDEAISSFSILGDISQGNAEKLQSLSGALGKITSSGKVTLEQLNVMTDSGFNPLQVISDQTGESMESLYDRVSKGTVSVEEITGAMTTATSAGGQFYQSMDKQSQTFNGRLSTLKDNFQQFTGLLFGGATSSAGSLLDVASGWIADLQTAFEEGGAEGLASALGTVFGEAVSMLVEGLPSLLGLASTIITSLTTSLSEMLVEKSGDISNLAVMLLQIMGSSLSSIFSLGVTFITQMLSGISSQMPAIISTVGITIMTMVNSLAANLPSILQSGITIVLSLINGLSQGLPTMIPKAVEMILTLVMGLLDNIDQLVDAGVNLLLGLTDGLINAIPMLVEKAPIIIGKLIVAFFTALPKIAEVSIKIVVALAKALVDNFPDLVAKIPGLVLDIIDGFLGMISDFADVGGDIVDGLWEGLSDGWDWLVDKISGLASDLVDTVCDVLDIHSPSREFAWIGKMSADGMVQGFDDADPLSAIKDTMVSGVNSLQMGVNSYVNGNIGGSYTSLADSIVGAITNSNMTIKVDKYEMGRIVRSYT